MCIKRNFFYDLRLIVQDADDDKFVNCAFSANAHYLVSDDKHYRVLAKVDFPKIAVLKFDEFKNILLENNP